MSRKFQLLAIGATIAVIMAGGLVYANATSSDGDQYCRTKAGYIRLSTTGECRRAETPIDLPTATDYNALLSGFNDLTASNTTLKDDVADLKRRVPTAREACGLFLFPGARLEATDLSCDTDLLIGANLTGAHLTGALLSGANLTGANLTGANLREAFLSGANLTGANLTGANLGEAFLSGANLTGANLSSANLRQATMWRTNLSGADLSGADLTSVQAYEITGAPASLPDGWSLIDGALTQTQAPDTDFGQETDVSLWNGGTVKATLSAPTLFNGNPLGFPEIGRYRDDRAMWFFVSITNTSNRTISVENFNLDAYTTGTQANPCRTLHGDDGSVTLIGAMNPDTWEPYNAVAPGESARWAWGFVCQADRGTPMAVTLSSPDIVGRSFVGRMP